MVISAKNELFEEGAQTTGRNGWKLPEKITQASTETSTEEWDMYVNEAQANHSYSRLDLGRPVMNSYETTNFRESQSLGSPSLADASKVRPASAARRILPDDFGDISDDISRVQEVPETTARQKQVPRTALATPISQETPSTRYALPLESDDEPEPEPEAEPEIREQEFVIEEVEPEREPGFEFEQPEPESDPVVEEHVRQAQREYEPQLLDFESEEDEYQPRRQRKKQRVVNNYEPPHSRDAELVEYTLDAENLPEPDYCCESPQPVYEFEVDPEEMDDELVDEMVVGELREQKDTKFQRPHSDSEGSDSEQPEPDTNESDDEIDIPSDFDVDAPREARTRVPRIASWRGERINYMFDPKTGTQTVESVHVVEEEEATIAKRAPKPKRALKPIQLDSVRTNEVEANMFDAQKQGYSQQVLAQALEGGSGYEVGGEDSGVYMRSLLPGNSPVAMGLLKLSRGAHMERQNSGKFWYTFIVLGGKIMMEVAGKQMVLQRESVVTVPKGNYYEIHNMSQGQARMIMIQAGSQQEADEASRTYDASLLSSL